MKKSLNLDLLEFHVREAAQELDLLLDAIQYAKERTRRKGAIGDEPLHWPLQEGALAVSLEHTPTTFSTSRGTEGSRRCGKRMRSLAATRSSRVNAVRSVGS